MSPQPAKAEEAPPAFDISPQVVFRLGDELISDEMQALVELVKNSYDASATEAVVVIDTESDEAGLIMPPELRAEADQPPEEDPASEADQPAEEDPGSEANEGDSEDDTDEDDSSDDAREAEDADEADEPQPALGWLEVQDNGDGMTRERLERGWLLISSSEKRAIKDRGETNRLGRTPLGDKGLGRLGVLRLGLQIEIRTRPRDAAEEHIIRFSRSDFQQQEALSEIRPHYEVQPLVEGGSVWQIAQPFTADVACSPIKGRQGTTVRVTGLINPHVWRDHPEVQREMLSLISPFEQIDNFELSIYVDDPTLANPLPLGELAELRRNLADVRWRFDFDGERLELTGRLKLRAFEPAKNNERLTQLWEALVAPDHGEAYRARLTADKLRGVEPRPDTAPYWLQLKLGVRLADLTDPKGRRRKKDDSASRRPNWVSPGPFSGELDSFDLASDVDLTVDGQSIFVGVEPYRAWVRQVRGLRVYRDGFGVRVGEDFLKLGGAFTGGRSFWALRPGNVVGFLSISARDNQQLQETTDREGFVANAAYRSLDALLQWVVERINMVQSGIGRELSDWANEVTFPEQPRPSRTAADLAEQVKERAERTNRALTAVEAAQQTLREFGSGGALLTPQQERGARQAGQVMTDLRDLVAEWKSLQQDLQELAEDSERIERERSELRDQLRVAYQTVGLGIVAETVAHEMSNITGRLLAEANAIAPGLKGPEHRDARALVGEVRRTVRAIRLQLRHLEPQLRYQRARREKLDVAELARDVADFHRGRFGDEGITIDVQGPGFVVRANRGRLQQALDNLFINSEFWLRHKNPPDPRIELMIKPTTLSFRDNGPGIDPVVEPSIFEPFVSGRIGDEGRGLGLFITRQVLRDDDATIYLGAADPDGRRRSFVIDLSGAVHEGDDA